MLALRRHLPHVEFEIFTTVPQWFFSDSLGERFNYHNFKCDIGLVQVNPFHEDLPATVAALDEAQLTAHSQIREAVSILRKRDVQLVVCDIAPLGIEAAREGCLPAVLVENFTWDFIYAGYQAEEPGLSRHIQRLKPIFTAADTHIQTAPVCQIDPAAYHVEPVSRPPVQSRTSIRNRLGLRANDRVILVTLGGIEEKYDARTALKEHSDCLFVLPGSGNRLTRDDNLILLPHHNEFYHPDLVQASDAVIGKLGYSTVAEVYHAGLPFAYLPRPDFPETPSMAEFARDMMAAMELSYPDFLAGRLGDLPERLLTSSRRELPGINGADQIAEILLAKYS